MTGRRVPDRQQLGPWVHAYTWWREELRGLSDAAWRLHVEAMMWNLDALADGHLSVDELVRLSYVDDPKGAAAELVDVGVWELAGDGWRIDPRGGQRSRADVEHDRARNDAKQRAFKARQRDAADLAADLAAAADPSRRSTKGADR